MMPIAVIVSCICVWDGWVNHHAHVFLNPCYAASKAHAPQQDPERETLEEWIMRLATQYPVDSDDDPETKLLKQRASIARLELEQQMRLPADAQGPVHVRLDVLKRLMHAEIELAITSEKVVGMLEEILRHAKAIETQVWEQYGKGRVPIQEQLKATYFRMEVELKLLRASGAKNE